MASDARRPKARRAGQKRVVQDVDARLDELAASIEALKRQLEAIDEKLGPHRMLVAMMLRQERVLDAIVRRLFLDPEQLDYPERLTAQRFGLQSQSEEEGILLALLDAAGTGTRRFVELGCGGNGGNSGFLASELGWSGLMVDTREDAVAICRLKFPAERIRVVQHWVTRESVDGLLRDHGLTGEIDVLSIDIDGNDYWVWEALTEASPRIVIVEYNARFGPERAVAVPYDPSFDRGNRPKGYFGASLEAFRRLGTRKGYRLVTTEPGGANAFFVRDDVAPEVPAAEVRDVFRYLVRPDFLYRFPLAERHRDRVLHPESVYAEIESLGLPLEDL